jgi:hypothetical protein
MHEVAGANNEVRRLRGRVSDRQGDRKEMEETLMALPFRLSGMGILSHQVIPWLCQQPTRHQTASSTRSCPFPPIWTLPKKPNPNPSMNGASSSGRINGTSF